MPQSEVNETSLHCPVPRRLDTVVLKNSGIGDCKFRAIPEIKGLRFGLDVVILPALENQFTD